MKPNLGRQVAAMVLACGWGCHGPQKEFVDVTCRFAVTPSTVDFGAVSAGSSVTEIVTFSNLGEVGCQVEHLGFATGSDPEFSLLASQPRTLSVTPGGSVAISVTFAAPAGAPNGSHRGVLSLQADDAMNSTVDVSLSATVQTATLPPPPPPPPPPGPTCQLNVAPASLDFGTVAVGNSIAETVTLSNKGEVSCQITELGLNPGSDPSFSLAASQPSSFVVLAGASATVVVTFATASTAPEMMHSATLTLRTGEPSDPTVSVPLSATTATCRLWIAPASLDFGTVLIGETAIETVTLSNLGNAACQIADLGFDGTSDPSFTLQPSQPASFAVPIAGSVNVSVVFETATTLPATRTGTLILQTGDPANPIARIPLAATVKCGAACDTGTGCSDGTGEGFTDQTTYPNIAGCAGAWSVPGIRSPAACGLDAGNDSNNPNGTGCAAADLCSSNFHLCTSQSEVAADLPSGGLCSSVTTAPNVFFATAVSGPGCGMCTVNNVCAYDLSCTGCEGLVACENDLFGCGSMGNTPDSATCGVLNLTSGNACDSLTVGGWSCNSPSGVGPSGVSYDDGCTENAVVTKSDGLSGGGVLCCKN